MMRRTLILIFLIFTCSCGGHLGGRALVTSEYSTPPIDQLSGGMIQSVGINATALISNSNGDLLISSNIAVFNNYSSLNFTQNIGIGDVIIYGSNYAIIKGLLVNADGAKAYVTLKDGVSVPPAESNSDFSIYRAFNSLYNWEEQTPNVNITSDITLTDLDLSDSDDESGPLYVACYEDGGADTTGVRVFDWTTTPTNFIRIFTPVTSNEVGVSQRHSGIWNASKYRLELTNTSSLRLSSDHIRIDGLQILLNNDASNSMNGGIRCNSIAADAEFYISNNIMRGNLSGASSTVSAITTGSILEDTAIVKVWNNIVYNWYKTNDLTAGTTAFYGGSGTYYYYNNTAYSSKIGFGFGSSTFARTIYNNLSINNSVNASFTDYSFPGGHTSSNNISSDGTSPDAAFQNKTVSFVDPGAYLLDVSDADAIGTGLNLLTDPNLSFSTDIQGGTRDANWDIGADEYNTP